MKILWKTNFLVPIYWLLFFFLHRKTIQSPREKIFEQKNSYLCELFEVKHIKTIYNIILVFLFISFIHMILIDLLQKGEFNFGQKLIVLGFARFQYAAALWLAMFVFTMLTHPVFRIWANGYNLTRKSNKKLVAKCWNIFFFAATLAYHIMLFYLSIQGLVTAKLSMVNSFAILSEMLRMSMKIHSYVRTNVTRVIDGNEMYQGPKFPKYLYFFFCPTLIYRDEYSRTKVIRWNVVFCHFTEVIGVVFFQSFILSKLMLPAFEDFGRVEMTLGEVFSKIIGRCLPGTLILVSFFYMLLHAWMNAFSEMLRFGDRMFYKDWWNSRSFDNYFRTWNIIVQDWLYQFIYREVYEHVFKGSKVSAALVTFTVSALFHELVVSFMFRFFYPVLLVAFNGFALVLTFVNTKKFQNWGNIIIWLALTLGQGIVFSLYMMEWYARKNCGVGDLWEDYFIPVSWTCNKILLNHSSVAHTP